MKRSKLSRVLAILLLAIYAVLLGIFIYLVIVQSQYILAMLFVIIIYPIIIYIILWLNKVFSKNEE